MKEEEDLTSGHLVEKKTKSEGCWWHQFPVFKLNSFNSWYLDPRSPVGFEALICSKGFVSYFLNKLLNFTSIAYKYRDLTKQDFTDYYGTILSSDHPVAAVGHDPCFFIDFRRDFNAKSIELYSSYLTRCKYNCNYIAVILADSFPDVKKTGPFTFTQFNGATESFSLLKANEVQIKQQFLLLDVNKFQRYSKVSKQPPFPTLCKALFEPDLFLNFDNYSSFPPELQVAFLEMRNSLFFANCWNLLRKRQEDIVSKEIDKLTKMHEWQHYIGIEDSHPEVLYDYNQPEKFMQNYLKMFN